MPGFGDLVQKAFYLGVGLATYAGEKAGVKLSELRSQAQKLADEMVAKGEMNTEEAKRFVEDLMTQAQQPPVADSSSKNPTEPRRIEILSDDEEPKTTSKSQEPAAEKNVDKLRQDVVRLQEELKRLQRDK